MMTLINKLNITKKEMKMSAIIFVATCVIYQLAYHL